MKFIIFILAATPLMSIAGGSFGERNVQRFWTNATPKLDTPQFEKKLSGLDKPSNPLDQSTRFMDAYGTTNVSQWPKPVPPPSIGDAVTFVASDSTLHNGKISSVKQGHSGRLVNLEVQFGDDTRPIENALWRDAKDGKQVVGTWRYGTR